MRHRRALRALLAFGSTWMLAADPGGAPFAVRVLPPDFVFRFAPRVEVTGRPSLALVLSGGGARAVADIGVIQRLEELGIPVDNVTGTSAGALMGTLMACGFSGQQIEELFTRVDFNRAFLDPLLRSPGRTLEEDEADNGTFLTIQMDGGVPSFALSLRDGKEIQRTLEGLLARGAFFSHGDFDSLKFPLRVVATNLDSGQGRVFDDGDLVEDCRASMAVPGAFSPVVIGGQHYVDGALVENLPVFIAKESFHPDLTLAVDVSTPLEARSVSNFFSLAARSLDLVVERRQWESRAAASFLVRPDIKPMDFTNYGDALPALVRAGRAAFDAQMPAMRSALQDRLGGAEVLAASGYEVRSAGPVPPGALAVLRQVLPEGRPLHRLDVLEALQKLLLHGWVKDASASLVPAAGGQVLRFELTPFAPVRAWAVTAPAPLRNLIEDGLRAQFPLGAPFNPETFGAFLGGWVHRIVMEGTPLVDVRGSGFDDARGVLNVVVRDPRIRTVSVRGNGAEAEFNYLKAEMAPLIGLPLRTSQLRQYIDLAEQRLNLLELRYQLRPLSGADGMKDEEGVDLVLVPVHHRSQSLALNLGYESNLGGETGFTYRTVNFGGVGVEGELQGARNRLQDRVSLAVRGPMVRSFPGAGMELRAATERQRLDGALLFPSSTVPLGPEDGRINRLDLGLGWFVRYGNLGQGKAGLEATWREAAISWDAQRNTTHQRTLELATEWDNLDRHTFPREGLLLRGRYGAGESLAVPGPGATAAPPTDFRYGYVRARGLTAFGSERSLASPGLDLDLEWGYGKSLPLDRWWTLGGSSFLLGSQAMGTLAPDFLVARLGFPIWMQGPYGSSFQAIPRFDYGMIAADAGAPFGPNRGQSTGLLLRTILAKFYVELSYGFLRTRDPLQGWSRTSGSFNALIGTQPFDIWSRH